MIDTNQSFAERAAQLERKRAQNEARAKEYTAREQDILLRERELEARLEACETVLMGDERELNKRETRLLILERELQSKEEVVTALEKRIVRPSDSEAPSLAELEAREAQADEADARVSQLEKSVLTERTVISDATRVEIETAPALPEQELNVSPADDPWKAPGVAEGAQAEAQPSALSPSKEVEAPEVEEAEQAPPETAEEAERAERARDRAKKVWGIPTWLWITSAFAGIFSVIAVMSAAFLPAPHTPSWGPAVRQVIEGDKQEKLERVQRRNERNAELEKKKEVENQEDLTR